MTAYTTGASGGGYVGLNWTPGTNVTAQLRALCLSLDNSGHSLRLEGMFNLSGLKQVTTPQNFTIDAVPNVGGFNFTDTATRGDECMTVTSGNTIKNLILRASNSPPYNPNAGNNPVRGTDYHSSKSILVNGNNVLIEACRCEGTITNHFKLAGDNIRVRLCEIKEGYWALGVGDCNNLLLEYVWFHDWYVDAMKTMNEGLGARNSTMRFCNFKGGNGRDAIDLTGGWKDGVFEDLKIADVGVVCFDLKHLYDSTADATLNRGLCQDITFNRIMAIGVNRICTLTHLENGDEDGYTVNGQPALYTNPSNGPTLCPQRITFNDCDFGYAQSSWLLMKGGRNVVTNNCRWRGLTQQQLPVGRTSYNRPMKSMPTTDPYYDVYLALTDAIQPFGDVNNNATSQPALSLPSGWYLPTFQYGPGATDTGNPSPAVPPAPAAGGPAVSVNPSTGLMTVRPSRLPSLAGKQVTARARVGSTTVSDTFELTNALV